MQIHAVRTSNDPLPAAHAAALQAQEPIFVPAAVHADDRGWSIMNQLQGVMGAEGQINYSLMYPNVIKAWHRHKLQTDFWMCVMGHARVGIYRESPHDSKTWSMVLGQMKPGVLIIPNNLWHGVATVSHEPCGLFYYVTHAFNLKNPDEERRAYDSVTGFPWTVQHR